MVALVIYTSPGIGPIESIDASLPGSSTGSTNTLLYLLQVDGGSCLDKSLLCRVSDLRLC